MQCLYVSLTAALTPGVACAPALQNNLGCLALSRKAHRHFWQGVLGQDGQTGLQWYNVPCIGMAHFPYAHSVGRLSTDRPNLWHSSGGTGSFADSSDRLPSLCPKRLPSCHEAAGWRSHLPASPATPTPTISKGLSLKWWVLRAF